MRRRRRKLSPEQNLEKQQQAMKRLIDSSAIVRKIKESLVDVTLVDCCDTCRHGESRYGGWTCGYEGTWCRLLYAHISISSGSSEAFKGQVVQKYNVCKLYEKGEKGE